MMFNDLLARGEKLQAQIAKPVEAPALLLLRLSIAIPFFRSGLTKWDGFFNLSSGARYLFTQEFKLHFFWGEMAYPFPLLMAFLAGLGEILLPIFLVLGLGTRLAALGIIAMTVIIQLTVPDGLINFHLPWLAMALGLLAFGGGAWSADHLLGRFGRSEPHKLDGRLPS